jgi:AcrR family transcriptional regulator
MDKRSLKSREMLQAALLERLREEAFENIDIQSITDKADTARVTFYRHYGTKEELLLDVLENIYQVLQVNLVDISLEQVLDFRNLPPSFFLFSFLASDRLLHKKLLTGSTSALVQARIRHYIIAQVQRALSKDNVDLPVTLIANQMASILIGNIMWWLAEDLPYSPEQMAQLSHWTVIGGIMTLLGRSAEINLVPLNWEIK